jgi:hypothetical protein
MRKIWFRLAFAAFAAIIAEPAPAQDHHKNFVECTKELGLQPDPKANASELRRQPWRLPASLPSSCIACGPQARRSNGTLTLHLQPAEAIEISLRRISRRIAVPAGTGLDDRAILPAPISC